MRVSFRKWRMVRSAATCGVMVVGAVQAQSVPLSPPVVLPVTAAEYAAERDLYTDGTLIPTSGVVEVAEPSSPDALRRIDSAIAATTRAWVRSLQTRPVRGLQMDAMGRLAVAAGQDTLARRQFAERLATPGLSLHDRAYTLLEAVRAFAATDDTARIRFALHYQALLDVLPHDAIMYRFLGRLTLAHAYRFADDPTTAIAQFRTAFALVPSIPFERRSALFFDSPFVPMADLLAGLPNGRASIDSLAQLLRAFATPNAQQLARDPAYASMSADWTSLLDAAVRLVAHLGRPAPSVIATHWLNTVAPAETATTVARARVKRLDDGLPRLVALCSFHALGCLQAIEGMGRLIQNMSEITGLFVTGTDGYWGATFVEPAEEARLLRHYYLDRKRFAFPIAILENAREPKPWGGVAPRDDLNTKAFAVNGPAFVVVDGKGIIRHIMLGGGPLTERLLQRRLRRLGGPGADAT